MIRQEALDLIKSDGIYSQEVIDALEQEPCDDAISRQAVLEQINCWIGNGEYRCTNATYYLTERVKDISPVNPQEPKTEKIIKMRDATPEERESIDKYIKSISKPTVVNFWDLVQEPKAGHWIYDEDKSDWHDTTYRCSCCKRTIVIPYESQKDLYNDYPYCHCGARMVEPWGSEG